MVRYSRGHCVQFERMHPFCVILQNVVELFTACLKFPNFYFRLDMKPFLLGKTEVLPRAIDVNKTVSPSPFILVDATPEMVVKVEKKGQKWAHF